METYFDNMTAADGSKEKLARDLRVLVGDGKDLLSNASARASQELKSASCAVDRTVRRNPYTSVVVGFGLGVVLGWILGSGRD